MGTQFTQSILGWEYDISDPLQAVFKYHQVIVIRFTSMQACTVQFQSDWCRYVINYVLLTVICPIYKLVGGPN